LPDLTKRGDLLRFIAGAVLLGPAAGALVGATVLTLSSGGSWPEHALQWVAGDGIAVLVIGGPILLWARRRELVSSRWPELALLGCRSWRSASGSRRRCCSFRCWRGRRSASVTWGSSWPGRRSRSWRTT